MTKEYDSSGEIKKMLEKITGFDAMCAISKIPEGMEMYRMSLPDDLSFDDKAFMRYAPIASLDVERNFWTYKNLLTDNRQLFFFDNIKRALVV